MQKIETKGQKAAEEQRMKEMRIAEFEGRLKRGQISLHLMGALKTVHRTLVMELFNEVTPSTPPTRSQQCGIQADMHPDTFRLTFCPANVNHVPLEFDFSFCRQW